MPYYPPLSSAAVIAALGYTPVNKAGDTMTGALVISLAGVPLMATTTGTSGSRQVTVLEGINSAPAANDTIYVSAILTNASSTQLEFGRLSVVGTTLTAGSEQGQLLFSVRNGAGGLVNRAQLTSTAFSPPFNDIAALGTTSLSWADLFLASGAVLNFANGNFTITHSSATLTVGEAMNFAFGTTTGTKFGTGTTQKIGFYNATPVAQQTGVAVSAAGIHAALVALGLITA